MMNKVNYQIDKDKQRHWFPYSYSEHSEDFVIPNGVHGRCPNIKCSDDCKSDNPDYWKNFSITDTVSTSIDIGCFGCSFTYGSFLEHSDSWPDVLEKQTGVSTGNFGIPGGGIDSCFINLKNAYHKFGIKRAVVLVPYLDRRLCSFKINNLYFQYPIGPHSLWPFDDVVSSAFFDKDFIETKIEETKKDIVLDVDNKYSWQKLDQIIEFCKNKIDLYVSSYDRNVYKKLIDTDTKTLSFYDLNAVDDRAVDKQHPCGLHNKIWVDSIKTDIC